MSRFVVLAQSPETAAALRTIHNVLEGGTVRSDGGWVSLHEIVVEYQPPGAGQPFDEAGIERFATLARRLQELLEGEIGLSQNEQVVVLVDHIQPSQLDPTRRSRGWGPLVARLILAFPEIRWVFGIIDTPDDKSLGFPSEHHDVSALFEKPHRSPLLDPSGLRDFVRQRANDSQDPERPGSPAGIRPAPFQLPLRQCRAAAIDEEVDFALLHGYAAYRFGFRADLVTTWSLMKSLFGDQEKESHGFDLLIEDVRLRFPDKPGDIHLSSLATEVIDGVSTGREHHCPLLSNSRDTSSWRILVTTGQNSPGENVVQRNEDYLAAKPTGRALSLFKPVGGVFDLWHDAELLAEPGERSGRGYAKDFTWPPEALNDAWSGQHAAPGLLTMLAENLLARAAEIRARAATLADSIRAAVLATDAVELLGGRTPALTLSGLALKHEMEVHAECAFVGAGFHFEVGRRLEAIEAEISAVSAWFDEKRRRHAALDARAGVINRLVLVYREAGQAEEMEECLVALRAVNRKMRRPKTKNAILWLEHSVLAYGEWLMKSFWRIPAAIGAWLALFVLGAAAFDTAACDWLTAGGHAFTWFFGGETAGAKDGGAVIALLAIPVGILHIGILISFLYSLIARK